MDLSQNIQNAAIMFVPFMMAVCFHEYAHGFIASFWGDTTAKDSGRLTLNPIPHIDPLGTLIFPLVAFITGIPILFGWAKPVPINPTRFTRYRPGLFWVSFAGPAMNILLGILSALALGAWLRFIPDDFYLFRPIGLMCLFSVQLNYMLCAFNLIPLPPLDGSKMIQSFLSYNATRKFEELSNYSFFILMALLLSGALRVIVEPTYFFANQTIALALHLFNVNVQLTGSL